MNFLTLFDFLNQPRETFLAILFFFGFSILSESLTKSALKAHTKFRAQNYNLYKQEPIA